MKDAHYVVIMISKFEATHEIGPSNLVSSLSLYIKPIDMLYESDKYKHFVLQKSRQRKLVTGYGRQDSPSTPSSLKVTLHHART